MSSLSQQLKVIGEKNASVALDRKTRSRIHSRSLIFDPKVAAAQDFDYLFKLASDRWAELLVPHSGRFDGFLNTFFSEETINFDRHVQTKETLAQLNKHVDAFLELMAPLYDHSELLEMTEWLVRRFHINVHNSEAIMLSVLPYFDHPVFLRFMNVIPEDSWPPILAGIVGYKNQMKCPPASSILKVFHNDPAFFRLYSEYLVKQLKNECAYERQLLFYASMAAQVLVSHSRDPTKLNDDYLPALLRTVNELLVERNHSREGVQFETRLAAYTIIAVLSSILPLTDEMVFTLSKAVTEGKDAFTADVRPSGHRRQTIILLGQLWNYYNELDLSSDIELFSNVPIEVLSDSSSVIPTLILEKFNITKFLYFYFVDRLNHRHADALEVLQFLDVSSSEFLFEGIARKLVSYLFAPTEINESSRRNAVQVFNKLLKADKAKFLSILEQNKKTISDLELVLMHTLAATSDADVSAYDAYLEDVSVELEKNDIVGQRFAKYKTQASSFFSIASSDDFAKMTPILLDSVRVTAPSKQGSRLFRFARITIDKQEKRKVENQVSYFLRLALMPSVPTNVRLAALACTRTRMLETVEENSRINFYLLVPIILLGFSDENKQIRRYFLILLQLVHTQSAKLNEGNPKKVKCDLFMESQIYGETEASKRSLISPQDAQVLLDVLQENNAILSELVADSTRVRHVVFDVLFKSVKAGLKKFGSLLIRTFILTQWSLPQWPLVLKLRVWLIMAAENIAKNGTDDRFFFVEDVKLYIENRPQWLAEALFAGIELKEDVDTALVNIVGGQTTNEKKINKEVDWILKALSTDGVLQITVKERLIKLFPTFKSREVKLRIFLELVDLVVNENDLLLEFDPVETLQSLDFTSLDMIELLGTINIVKQIPDQGVAKRRRRSSSSTQKNMARDDISSMASAHLRKLSVALDILESQLRQKTSDIANPELLQALFKILTDLDYLGNEGKMPVLYAQESLATCMLLSIVQMKELSSRKKLKFDSNSIRADLIVNSIRLSQSPQVQNRLLLVIAELASLAPEIILHSVMPIFTFMGAHTIRQDDEFSSSALQQTIAKVIPAITGASSSVSNEIEFLLTSFVTAFQHIPRHRRVKLFVSLIKTLGCDQSLHLILFLMAQQYSSNAAKGKMPECNSLLDFVAALVKTFSADECLDSICKFYELWETIPETELDKHSDEYTVLSGRSVFGSSIVNLTTTELVSLKHRTLTFINQALKTDEETSLTSNTVSLKMKVSLVLFDDLTEAEDKESILQRFNQVTSFILSSLEHFSATGGKQEAEIVDQLYELLKSLLNLLPLSYYISSITGSLKNVTDPLSIKIAKNFAVLAGTKFESEVNANSIDDEFDEIVLEKLLPILIEGVEKFDDVELVQAYLDTFCIIVTKIGTLTQDLATSSNAKFLLSSLKTITSEHGLLNSHPEIIVSSLNSITSVISILGVKAIGLFPKILPPALKIWETTADQKSAAEDSESEEESDDEDDGETEAKMLIQGSILMLFSCLVKKMPAFVISNLKQILKAILLSDLIETGIRSSVLTLVVDHIDKGQVLQSLCNMALNDEIYSSDNAADLGLYLSAVKSTIDSIEKKAATAQSSLFMKWLIKSFGFRTEYGEQKFTDNTIYSIEGSFHQCGISYVMKLNDKSFRPLFASLVRWAVSGEGSLSTETTEIIRLTAFFRFFNKVQDNLKSIVTSYFSYLLDPTIAILKRFQDGSLEDINLRRILLHSLASSFKYDQDDYWTHQLRFDTIVEPLLGQLANIEESIGKHLVKTISFFVSNVSSDEYNDKLVHTLIKYVSNEHDNSVNTKIWTIRVLKTVFQKMGEQWLSFLPTFIPYIAELLEDDDEEVEMEVRKDLVRVIENILGEPLDRYLS